MRKCCQAVIRANGGLARYSQFCELFITLFYQILLIYWQNIAIKWKVRLYLYARMVYLCLKNLSPTSFLEQNENAIFERCRWNIGVVYFTYIYTSLHKIISYHIHHICTFWHTTIPFHLAYNHKSWRTSTFFTRFKFKIPDAQSSHVISPTLSYPDTQPSLIIHLRVHILLHNNLLSHHLHLNILKLNHSFLPLHFILHINLHILTHNRLFQPTYIYISWHTTLSYYLACIYTL